jgi:MFS transporter
MGFPKIKNLAADRSPFMALALMTAATQLSFAAWYTLAKNFGVDAIGMTGAEIGLQETIREIPGFLAFLVIYVLLFMREQTLALISLAVLGVWVGITGFFPTVTGFLLTTFIMSVGFHYFETVNQSLQLQWLPKAEAPKLLGKLIAVAAGAQLGVYALIALVWKAFALSFEAVFMLFGAITLVITAYVWRRFPYFKEKTPQHKKLIVRRRYWLYYALTFMSGARRQIFTVFAALLMVQKFGYEVHEIALLFLINTVFNIVFAPKIGALIGRFGERYALRFEYIGLIGVFIAYAFVSNPWAAAGLYIVDHAFFAMAIAIKTYFQKIADPADMAGTAGFAFTINHVAAVIIPVSFGLVWLVSPALVFLLGAVMACGSLALTFFIPRHPEAGAETIFAKPPLAAQ